MSSRNKIYEALDENSRGDVEKYFHHLCTMIEKNSGVHEYNITSADCYNNNAPFKENQFTRFSLTNNMDIIDISKGFIAMRVNVDVQFLYDNLQATASTTGLDSSIFFIGFRNSLKSLINSSISPSETSLDKPKRRFPNSLKLNNLSLIIFIKLVLMFLLKCFFSIIKKFIGFYWTKLSK